MSNVLGTENLAHKSRRLKSNLNQHVLVIYEVFLLDQIGYWFEVY